MFNKPSFFLLICRSLVLFSLIDRRCVQHEVNARWIFRIISTFFFFGEIDACEKKEHKSWFMVAFFFFHLFGNNLSELICHIKLKLITFAAFFVENERVRVREGSRECHWHEEKMKNRGHRDLRGCNWYGFKLIKWKVFPISANFYFRNVREFSPFYCQMLTFFSNSFFSSLLYYTEFVLSFQSDSNISFCTFFALMRNIDRNICPNGTHT